VVQPGTGLWSPEVVPLTFLEWLLEWRIWSQVLACTAPSCCVSSPCTTIIMHTAAATATAAAYYHHVPPQPLHVIAAQLRQGQRTGPWPSLRGEARELHASLKDGAREAGFSLCLRSLAPLLQWRCFSFVLLPIAWVVELRLTFFSPCLADLIAGRC
jgi:hypothetical protein